MSEKTLIEALEHIRDSTYRNAVQLRSIAERALEAHRQEPVPYRITEAGRAMLRDAQQGVE